MKKLLFLFALLISAHSYSQVLSLPNGYGARSNRSGADMTQLLPSFVGVPLGIDSLRMSNYLNRAAIGYDIAGKKAYIFDPTTLTWSAVNTGGGAVWGAITGSLPSQTDLRDSLAALSARITARGTVFSFSFTNSSGITGTVTNSTSTPTLSLVIDTAAIANFYVKVRSLFTAGTGMTIANGVIATTITQYTDALARASISSSATGLTYTSSTGIFSLTAGYTIPTSTTLASFLKLDGSNGPMTGNLAFGGFNITGVGYLSFANINGRVTGTNSAGQSYSGIYDDSNNPLLRVKSGGTGLGNTEITGTLTVTGLAAGSAGNFVVNGGSGLFVTRTAAQVLSDIGAAAATGSTAYIQNQFASAQTSASAWIDGNWRVGTNTTLDGTLAVTGVTTLSAALNGTTGLFTGNMNLNRTVYSAQNYYGSGTATGGGSIWQWGNPASSGGWKLIHRGSVDIIQVDSATNAITLVQKTTVSNSTASTSATTGAFVVTGGVGINGATFMTGTLTMAGGSGFSISSGGIDMAQDIGFANGKGLLAGGSRAVSFNDTYTVKISGTFGTTDDLTVSKSSGNSTIFIDRSSTSGGSLLGHKTAGTVDWYAGTGATGAGTTSDYGIFSNTLGTVVFNLSKSTGDATLIGDIQMTKASPSIIVSRTTGTGYVGNVTGGSYTLYYGASHATKANFTEIVGAGGIYLQNQTTITSGLILPMAGTNVAAVTIDRTATSNNGIIKFTTGGSDTWILGNRNTSDETFRLFNYALGADAMIVSNTTGNVTWAGSVTATSFFESSDIRLKKVKERDGDMIGFLWNNGLKRDNKYHYGYSAQDVEKKLPNQVATDEKGYKSVNYIEVLVYKVRNLEKEIEKLKSHRK